MGNIVSNNIKNKKLDRIITELTPLKFNNISFTPLSLVHIAEITYKI